MKGSGAKCKDELSFRELLFWIQELDFVFEWKPVRNDKVSEAKYFIFPFYIILTYMGEI